MLKIPSIIQIAAYVLIYFNYKHHMKSYLSPCIDGKKK